MPNEFPSQWLQQEQNNANNTPGKATQTAWTQSADGKWHAPGEQGYTGGSAAPSGGQPAGGKNVPNHPDFQGAGQADMKANRPNQHTPFASSQWTQNPDGTWTQNTSMSDLLKGATTGAAPIDWSKFGPLDTGAGARQQAIDAAYGDAKKRLDPEWAQRQQSQAQALANQGLDPNSEAYRNAQRTFSAQQNDAYGSAMSSAIDKGTAAGNSVFQNSMVSRQQAIAEALKARGMPMQDIQNAMAAMGFAPTANVGNNLQSAGMTWNADLGRWEAQNKADADRANAIANTAGQVVNAGLGIAKAVP